MITHIISEAKRILNSQAHIPLSPGMLRNNEHQLCLGAALVEAANRLNGTSNIQRQEIRSRMISGDSPESILVEAETAGLNIEFCQSAIVHNDNLSGHNRRNGISNWLNQIIH